MEGSLHLWGEETIPAVHDEEAAIGVRGLVDHIKRRYGARLTGELVVPGGDDYRDLVDVGVVGRRDDADTSDDGPRGMGGAGDPPDDDRARGDPSGDGQRTYHPHDRPALAG